MGGQTGRARLRGGCGWVVPLLDGEKSRDRHRLDLWWAVVELRPGAGRGVPAPLLGV